MSRTNAREPESLPRVRSGAASTPLYRARLAAGLRQTDLAALAAGLHPDTIRRLEQGQHTPTPRTAMRLAAALSLRPCDLWPDAADIPAAGVNPNPKDQHND
jgi:DNA-binding XRE family transcriptional regulator